MIVCAHQIWWRSRKRRWRWRAAAHTWWQFSQWLQLACPSFPGGPIGSSGCSSAVQSASLNAGSPRPLIPPPRCRWSYPPCRSWGDWRCRRSCLVCLSTSRCHLATAGSWLRRCWWTLRTRRPRWSANRRLSRTRPGRLPSSWCSAPRRGSSRSRGCRSRVGSVGGVRRGSPGGKHEVKHFWSYVRCNPITFLQEPKGWERMMSMLVTAAPSITKTPCVYILIPSLSVCLQLSHHSV